MDVNEKAKAYDAAIDKARRMLSHDDMMHIFPELVSSDDKLPDLLKKFVSEIVPDSVLDEYGISRDALVRYVDDLIGSSRKWVPSRGDVCQPKRGGYRITLCDGDGLGFNFVCQGMNSVSGGYIFMDKLVRDYDLVLPSDYAVLRTYVEPKFGVGDRIHCGDKDQVVTITGVCEGFYKTDNAIGRIPFEDQDDWVIADNDSGISDDELSTLKNSLYFLDILSVHLSKRNERIAESVSKTADSLRSIISRLNS